MRKISYISLLAFILFSSTFLLVGCRDDEENFQVIVIDTQEELALLVSNNTTRIDGDLFLGGDISDLQLLSGIEKIIGDVAIIDTQLTSLNGLENLSLVTGDIIITSTPPFQQNITNYCALQNLLAGGSFKSIIISNNTFNPSVQEIIEGDCSI